MKALCKYYFYILFGMIAASSQAQSVKDSIIVPNIFTPNADGLNDVFKPIFSLEGKIQGYKLEIFDRFGIKITESTKNNFSWDGRTTSGMPCPDGTYFYVIQLTINASKLEYKGFVQLIK